MKTKILLSLGAVLAVVAGVAAMSAWEAHVVNVTATIANALSVTKEPIEFGTVFPQEYLGEPLTIRMSESFNEQDRVDNISYVINQKPKPKYPDAKYDGDPAWEYCLDSWNNAWGNFMDCWEEENGDLSFIEAWEVCKGVLYDEELGYDRENCYPYLCPFLSKLPDGEPEPGNDSGVSAPHWPIDGTAYGLLDRSQDDDQDTWTIDLVVPCFQGMCDQDYNWWEYGPPLVEELEGNEFGCDLWIEVTGIE